MFAAQTGFVSDSPDVLANPADRRSTTCRFSGACVHSQLLSALPHDGETGVGVLDRQVAGRLRQFFFSRV